MTNPFSIRTAVAFLSSIALLVPTDIAAYSISDSPKKRGEPLTMNRTQETSPETKPSKTEQLFWIFLTTGKSTETLEREALMDMQRQHLENFKRLADEGKLLTAGPMEDPEKKLRGIVIVKAKDREALAEMFKADPYVQSGYLKVEATTMKFEHGVINTKITPQGLEEFRLVLVEEKDTDGQPTSTASVEQSESFLAEMSSDENLLLTVFLTQKQSERRAILVLKKTEDDTEIAAKLENIPAVKSGTWKTRIFPLRMGKGTLSSPE